MKFIDENSLNRLNFKDLLARVDVFSAYGKNKLNNLENFLVGEEEKLEEEFERMQKIYDFISENKKEEMEIEIVLHRFKDIKKLVENAEAGIILDTVDIFEIKAQLMAMVDLNSYLLKTQNSPQLNFIFQQIRESQAEGKILPLYLESKVMELLSIIITRLEEKEKNISVVLTKKDKQNLKRVVSAMKKDLSVHIDGLELSKIALMSPARFQLAFRKYYGVPPYEYLKELRLNKALLLLKNPEYKISTIAKKVGYTHTGHFAKIFKSTYGITPSKYRSTIT